MGISTGQWRASIGSLHIRFNFQPPGTNTNSLSTFALFYALVLAVLLVVGGVEVNPGPDTQSCCELCGVHQDAMRVRELAVEQREEAALLMLQQRGAACAEREKAVEQREAAVGRRERQVAEEENRPGTPAVNGDAGGVEVVRTLLEKELISKTRLLEWAVLNSFMTIARFLIKETEVDVNSKDSSGRSVPFLAVEHGVLAAVELLLSLSTEDVVDSAGELAFHSAVRKGHTDVVKYLLNDSRALATKKNRNGETALHLAAASGHLDIVKFLVLEAHCDVEVKDPSGRTALHLAASSGHVEIVKFLVLEAHCDVQVKNNLSDTALLLAAASGHVDVVKYIVLEAHCDVQVKGPLGWTALHSAVHCSHLSVAQFLVREARAVVGSKTWDGRTALQLSRSTEMLNLLRRGC